MVTICIPTYNGEKYIEACLASALEQTYKSEVILIDDCSTDKTWELSRGQGRVRLIQNGHHLGMVENWNRCLKVATGEWIKFLHQDDILEPNCVEKMLAAQHPFVVCKRDLLIADDVLPERAKVFLEIPMIEQSLTARQFVPWFNRARGTNRLGEPSAVLFHRSMVDKYGVFLPDLVQVADWEYWVRIGINEGVAYVDEPLCMFRLHNDSAATRVTSHDIYADGTRMQLEISTSPHYRKLR